MAIKKAAEAPAKRPRAAPRKRPAAAAPAPAPVAVAPDYPAVAEGVGYARRVLADAIPACGLVRLACERFLRDLADAEAGRGPWAWAPHLAERALRFCGALPNIKGPLAGKPLAVMPWQAFVFANLFGFVERATGARRFRQGVVFVPRGNGKTTIAAPIALYLTFADGEGGAEGYAAAVTRDQARILFDTAREMVLRSPALAGLRTREGRNAPVEAGANAVFQLNTASRFKPISSDAKALDGLNVQVAVCDEIASHRTSEVYDVLLTAMGKRSQPLLLSISTATGNTSGIGRQLWDYASKVLHGEQQDERLFALIYTLDLDARETILAPLPALDHLGRVCDCHSVPTTRIASLAAGAFAARATCAGGRQTPNCDAPIIPSGPRREADCARNATGSPGKTILSKRRQPERLPHDGLSAIPTEFGSSPNVGAPQTLTGGGRSNTGFAPKNTSPLCGPIADGAASAASDPTTPSKWIIATARERFGASYADPATLDSVSSEILRKVYHSHSPTCSARSGSLEPGGLRVTLPPDDPWSEASWIKANPSWGQAVQADAIRAIMRQARNNPAQEAAAKTRHLNVWVGADEALFSTRAWQACEERGLSLDEFEGRPCHIGLDLARKTDLAAMAIVFPGRDEEGRATYRAFARCYLNEAAVLEARNPSYPGWAAAGHLTITPGDETDFGRIEDDLRELCARFEVRSVGTDPWQAAHLSQRLRAEGVPMFDFRTTTQNLSPAINELDAAMRSGRLAHDGNPVLGWCVGNVVGQEDRRGNLFPAKVRENRIDAAVALLMAVGRAQTAEAEPARGDISSFFTDPLFA